MNKGVIKKIWNYVGKYKLQLVIVLICAFIGNSLAMAGPKLMGIGIDEIASPVGVNFQKLIKIIIVMAVIYIISGIFQYLLAVVSNKIANKTIEDIRKDAFSKINRMPVGYFDTHAHGDVISRMTNDIDAISEGLFQGTMQIMSGIIVIVGSFVFMISISFKITLIIVALVPICMVIASFIAKHSSKMFKEQSKTVGELNGYAEEIIGNLKEVKAFAYEETAREKFMEINNRLYDCGQKAQWYSSLTNPTTRYVNNLGYVAVTIVGGVMAVLSGFSAGNIAGFLAYSNQFAKPINEITSITTQIQSALASAGRIFSFMEESEEIEEKAIENNKEVKGLVEFRNVSFSYRKDVPLIEKLSLKAEQGNLIAIVGPTGAGKSTLINLLMRFYDVDEGEILIDNENIKEINRNILRGKFGMVLQESWLFKGTVAENIAYGVENATKEEIIAAAKEAHAHSFIKRLKNGYDTVIEEEGSNLSGGQKQLLTIARVMLINPPMLVLDEATSSIDTRTEQKIQQAFNKMMENKTSFVIAHRLSTIREADTILVMKDGHIIEQGNHRELLCKKGFYYELYNSQFEKN